MLDQLDDDSGGLGNARRYLAAVVLSTTAKTKKAKSIRATRIYGWCLLMSPVAFFQVLGPSSSLIQDLPRPTHLYDGHRSAKDLTKRFLPLS